MDLKKVEKKNPGWQFSKKVSGRASKTVLENAVKSDLDIDSYNLKYAGQVKTTKGSKDSSKQPKLNDKKWRMMKKESIEKPVDSPEDKKAGFYDEKGNEVASQG